MNQYLLSVYMVDGEQPPSPEDQQQAFKDVDALNATLQKEGVWVFAGGLHPATTATVVREKNGDVLTTDGPFAEAKEVIAGFWMIQVKSKEEALEWAKRCPLPENGLIEIRQVFEMTDFPPELQPKSAQA